MDMSVSTQVRIEALKAAVDLARANAEGSAENYQWSVNASTVLTNAQQFERFISTGDTGR